MSTEPMVEATLAELVDAVHALAQRVEHLETELQAVRQETPGVPDEVALVISAAVAAFLGQRAKVKQMHYRTGEAWAQQGRVVVQGRHNIHGSR